MSTLSPDVKARCELDLLATLRAIDLLESERSETGKVLREALKAEQSRVRVLRDVLEGRVSEQVALPGLEGPSDAQRSIGAALRRAVESVERITGATAAVQDFAEDDDATPTLAEARRVAKRRERHG